MGQPITVWRAALQQRRPYLDLEDGIRALLFVLTQQRFDREIYNVLTENLTVEDVINAIRVHFPAVAIEYVDSPIMNQLSYHVRCEKFRALGFEFEGGITRGVADTVKLLRNAGTLNRATS
jgi:nucleoside-diphosphate-sugar epimerase